MYSKVFEFDQNVQAGEKITFAWYEIQQQPPKKVKFHDLSNFAVILHFFNKIRIVVVRFFKKNCSTKDQEIIKHTFKMDALGASFELYSVSLQPP